MKKLLLIYALVILTFISVNAQEKHMSSSKTTTFGIGINGGIPTKAGWSVVAGADLQADIKASENLKITLSAGYETYAIKSSYGGGHSSLIPFYGGLKYNFSPNFYGHGQIGYAVSTVNGGGGSFAYSPSLGYNLNQYFDISVKYIGYGNAGSVGAVVVRLAYNF